jgi:UDP-3-O-[3-hydroxymyristoyl] glucosamine N-acyltransferase
MMGNPAVPMKTSIESYKAPRRLPRLTRKLADLQKQVSKLDTNE